MTASRAKRRRQKRFALLDRPPMFCNLRPMTLADVKPGQAMAPGMTVFVIRKGSDDGRPGDIISERPLRLPPDCRANTGANVEAVLRFLRNTSEQEREMMDKFYWFAPGISGDDHKPRRLNQ